MSLSKNAPAFPAVGLAAYLPLLVAAALGLMWWRWGGTVEDSQAYFDTARYLRGELGVAQLTPPFPYRIAVPALVAWLPFDLRATFATVNFLSILGAGSAMAAAAFHMFGTQRAAVLAGVLGVVNFCTFWYAPYLLVDPASLLARSVFVFALVTRRPALMAGTVLVATAIREENIVLAIWLLLSRTLRAGPAAALLAACAAWLVFVRWYLVPGLAPYHWTPHLGQVFGALTDLKSLASIALTAVLVVPLAVLGWRRLPAQFGALRSLLVLMALPPLYAALCVRVDGRAVWGLYPMLVPLAVAAIYRAGRTVSPLRA